MHPIRRFSIISLAWTAVALALGGCATIAPLKPEDAVRERAQARYAALIAKDYKRAYGFLSPTYREHTSLENHMRVRPVITTYVEAKVIGVECTTDSACTARLEVTSKGVKAPGIKGVPNWPITSVTTESWVRAEGDWWLHL